MQKPFKNGQPTKKAPAQRIAHRNITTQNYQGEVLGWICTAHMFKLPWYVMCARLCVCVCVCARACMRGCMRACVCTDKLITALCNKHSQESSQDRFLSTKWMEKRTNKSILDQLQTRRQLLAQIMKRKMAFFGHACRNNRCNLVKTCILVTMPGKRRRGRHSMQ